MLKKKIVAAGVFLFLVVLAGRFFWSFSVVRAEQDVDCPIQVDGGDPTCGDVDDPVTPPPPTALPAQCSDGATDCGLVGSGSELPFYPTMTSVISMFGTQTPVAGGPDYGQRCTSNGTDSTDLGQWTIASYGGWYCNRTQGSIPTGQVTDSSGQYDLEFYPNTPATVFFGNVDDAGSVSVGSYNYSYGGNNCGAASGGSASAATLSPGDQIILADTNQCTPNKGPAQWGGASAWVQDMNATECYTAAYFSARGQTGLGYYPSPTTPGLCVANAPVVSPAQIALSEASVGTPTTPLTDNITSPTTHPLNVLNVGGMPMYWDGESPNEWNNLSDSGLTLESKPDWIGVAEAADPIPAHGSSPETYTFDHAEVMTVGSPVQGNVVFHCEPVDITTCGGVTTITDTVNYLVPAPTGTIGLDAAIQSNQQPVLDWSAANYNQGTGTSNSANAICISGGSFSQCVPAATCTSGSCSGKMTANAITSPTTYTLTVTGLSDMSDATGNTAMQPVTVTPTAPPPVNLICGVTPSASQTQASQGANESFVFGVSGSQTGNYTWYSNGVANGAVGNTYVYSSSNPGTSPTISVTSSDGGSANCGTATVVAPAGVPTLSMKITDTTKVPNVSISSPNPPGNFTVGDNWTITVTGSDVSPGAGIYLCLPGSCTEDGSFANVVGGVGTWTFSGSFSVAGGPYTEWANLTGNTTGPQSNDVGFSVTPANTAFSCALTASPSTYITSGNTATIGWSTAASSCTGSGGIGSWSGSKAGSGSFTSALTSNTTFDMSCNNPSTGVSTACTPVTVVVASPSVPPLSCSALPSPASTGQTVTFTANQLNNPSYVWNISPPGNDSGSSNNSNVSDSWSTAPGPVIASVSSGGAVGACSVNVEGSSSSASNVGSVKVQCTQTSVPESGTFSCSAIVSPEGTINASQFNFNVTWAKSEGSLTGSSQSTVGTFSITPASASFIAPNNEGTMVITAISKQDNMTSGSATVTVTAPTPPVPTLKGVSVNCTPSMIYVNGTSTCSASLVFAGNRIPWFADANVGHNFISSAEAAGNPGFLWSTTFGTIDQNGNYTAPATPGTATIFGSTSTLNGLISGSSTITINPAPVPPPQPTNTATLTVSPRSADTATPVTLTATIGGTATGTVNYSFWWNCPGSYASVAAATAACGDPTNPANGAKFNGQPTASQSASTTYPSAGTYTPMVIVERGSAAPAEAQVSVSVANAAPTLSISANPSSVTFSQPVSLMWSSTNVSSCTASSSPAEGDWTGSKPTQSPVGGQTVIPTQVGVTSETYSLTCVGGNGMITKSAVVPVGAPPTVSCSPLMANPTNLVPPEQSTLSWSCSNASACTVNGTAVNPGNGNTVVTPATTTQYLLDCTGLGGWGTATSSVTITVGGTNIHETNP